MKQSCVILTKVKTGTEIKIQKELLKLKEVKGAYLVYGNYDMLIEMDTENLDNLNNLLTGRIRKFPGVISSKTFLISSA